MKDCLLIAGLIVYIIILEMLHEQEVFILILHGMCKFQNDRSSNNKNPKFVYIKVSLLMKLFM